MRLMTPRIPPVATAWALAALLSACSTQTAYVSVMEMRKQECRKNPDLAERARCEQEADRSYDRYQTEADAARRKP
jgi:hypothetical protein